MMVAEMLQTSGTSGHMTGNEPHGNPIAPLGMESDTVRYISILALAYNKDSLASAPRPSASIDRTRRSDNGDYNMMGARRLRMQLDEGSIERRQELFGCHL